MRYLAILVLAGCASIYTPEPQAFRAASSGQTGCAPDEIQIADTAMAGGQRTWRAVCRGVEYRCSGGVYYALIQDPRCTPAR